MSNIFIFGATGEVGSRLGPMLVKAGHSVTELHREPEQAEYLENAGMTACLGDIMEMTADDLTYVAKHSDVIVFSAGAGDIGAGAGHPAPWPRRQNPDGMLFDPRTDSWPAPLFSSGLV